MTLSEAVSLVLQTGPIASSKDIFVLDMGSPIKIIDLAIKGDIIEKTGAWFSYGDMKIGQGKENSKKYLLDNPDIYSEIIKKVRSFMGLDVEEKK